MTNANTATTTFFCSDNGFDCEEIEASSSQEAAEEYCDGCDWGDDSRTQWIDVQIFDVDPETVKTDNDGCDIEPIETITVTLEPDEPECDSPQGHSWAESIHLTSSGGGVKGTDICLRCGLHRSWNTWTQRPDTGEMVGDSTRYEWAETDFDLIAEVDGRFAIERDGEAWLGRSGKLVRADDDETVDVWRVVDGEWEE